MAATVLLGLAGCTAGAPSGASTSAVNTRTTPTPTTVVSPTSPPPTAHRPLVVRARLLRWRLPEPVAREAVAVGPHGVLVAGGMRRDGSSTAAAYELDLAGGRVHALPDLPVAVHDVAGVRTSRGFEVLGGGNSTEQDVVQVLHGKTRWTLGRALPTARSDLAAVRTHGQTYVVGGYDGVSPALADVLISGGRAGWRVLGPLAQPVRYPAVTVSGGAIWVIGGESSGAMVTAIQRIDVATGRVRVVAHLPMSLGHATAVKFGTRVLIVGGRTSQDRVTSSMWWFDPRSRSVTRAGALPMPLADSAAVVLGGSAYLLGGETPQVIAQVLQITPELSR